MNLFSSKLFSSLFIALTLLSFQPSKSYAQASSIKVFLKALKGQLSPEEYAKVMKGAHGQTFDDVVESALKKMLKSEDSKKVPLYKKYGLTPEDVDKIDFKKPIEGDQFMQIANRIVTRRITEFLDIHPKKAEKAYDSLRILAAERNPFKSVETGLSFYLGPKGKKLSVKETIQGESQLLSSMMELSGQSKASKLVAKTLGEKLGSGPLENDVFRLNIARAIDEIEDYVGASAVQIGCAQLLGSDSTEVLKGLSAFMEERTRLAKKFAETRLKQQNPGAKGPIEGLAQMTAKELDEVNIQSFKNTLGYTDEQARAAVKKLQSRPCRVIK